MRGGRAVALRALVAGLCVLAAGAAAASCGDDAAEERAPDGGGVLGPGEARPAGDAAAADVAVGADAADASDAMSDARDAADAALLAPGFVHRDINHVLGTGQSLSVGSRGSPPLTLTQPYANLTFVTGVMSGGTGLTSFIPLVEGDLLGATPVETLSSSFANLVTKTAREVVLVGQPAGKTSHDLLVSAHGVGGTRYLGLKKGTAPYANGMAQVTAGRDLALAAGKTYVVRAVTNVHGESDHVNKNPAYDADLLEWQADYEADVKAVTGQAEGVPMFQTQISSWTRYSTATSAIPSAQLAAHEAAPGKVVLVGPKYHLAYSTDGVHLTNEGYRHMGEDYAKAYRRVILEGKAWEPVRPKTITRAGAVITVKMHVPAPPLVIDTTRVSDPGHYGFEYTDDSGAPPAIASVAVTGPDTVVVTLASAPTGGNARLRYAYTGTIGSLAGPTTGPRGNLRDSDATPSPGGYDLFNWCVHFDAAVP